MSSPFFTIIGIFSKAGKGLFYFCSFGNLLAWKTSFMGYTADLKIAHSFATTP